MKVYKPRRRMRSGILNFRIDQHSWRLGIPPWLASRAVSGSQLSAGRPGRSTKIGVLHMPGLAGDQGTLTESCHPVRENSWKIS